MVVLTGLAAGAVHVLSGPDHLAAVAPIAADDPKAAAGIGIRWGLGHGSGAVAMGGLGILLRESIDLHVVSAWAEFVVGFALIAVGVWAFHKASRTFVHAHSHAHDGSEHTHIHVHTPGHDHRHAGHAHAAFGVGALHGAAGTGHLLGVLPALALPQGQAVGYLAAYFVAAVVSMGVFGGMLGMLVRERSPKVLQRVMYASATLSVVVGVVWLGSGLPH